jgi:putative transposase
MACKRIDDLIITPDVVGIFSNDAAIVLLVEALLREQNDEWQLQRRCMQI